MIKAHKSIKNAIWVIVANGTSSLFQFLLISIMTKQFSIDSVGLYSSATALILPIITLIMGLNLAGIQLTDVENKYSLSDFFTVRIIGALCTGVIVILVSIIKGNNDLAMIVTVAVLIRYISELFSEIANNQLIKKGYYSKYAFSIIIRAVSSFGIFLLVTNLTNNLILSLFSYSAVWIFVFFVIDFKNADVKRAFENYKFKRSTIFSLVIVSLPLAFVSSINVLYNSIPKYFIEYYMSLEALGIFSATSYISLIGGLFVTGITITFSTKLAQIDKNGESKKFIKIVLIQEILVILCCIALLGILYCAGDIILPILYTQDFVKYIDIVLLLTVGMSLNFTARVLGTACTSARKNKDQLVIACICIVALVISCWLLIPVYQLGGAAISMILAYGAKNILLVRVLVKKFTRENQDILKHETSIL